MVDSLIYVVPQKKRVVITNEVIKTLLKFSQKNPESPESGGQLFGEIKDKELIVNIATEPKKYDRRTRFSFWPNRRAEQEEINTLFTEGHHYVGDWHSHPQNKPSASLIDLASLRDCVKKSSHELEGFLMIIIGTAPFPTGIAVYFSDGLTVMKLKKVR